MQVRRKSLQACAHISNKTTTVMMMKKKRRRRRRKRRRKGELQEPNISRFYMKIGI
jgi:hypothetical protein